MKKILSLFVAVLLCCLWTTVKAETATVGSDWTSTNQFVPLNPSYHDTQGTRCQFIYTSSEFSAVAGKTLTGFRFYANANWAWSSSPGTVPGFTVKLKETTTSAFESSAFDETGEWTTVYTGQPSDSKGTKELYFEFTEGFAYSGTKNLMVDISISTAGGWQSSIFYYGQTTSDYVAYSNHGKGSSAARLNFTPKVEISYEEAGGSSCAKPTALEVAEANITATSAVVTWTKGDATSSVLEYKLSTATDWTVVDNATSPYELTGLTPLSTYSVRVKNDCGTDGQSGYLTTSFPTPCGVEEIPFTENFNSIGCWTTTNCNEYTGINSNTFRFRWTSTPPQYLISPELDTSGKQVQVSFDYKIESSGNPESFNVGYSTTTKELSAFTWGTEKTYTNTSYETYTEALPAGVKYIAIQCTSNNKYYLYIDNFSVTEYVAPACPAPTALAVGQIGADSAVVTWTSEAATIVLQYKKAGDADWTDATGTIASPFVLKNLLPNKTAYSVRVKADCGTDGESDWVESEEFLTKCESVTFGWSESFDAETLSECWSITVGNSTNSTWEHYKYADEGTYSGYSVRFKGKSGNAASVLQTPSLSLTDKAALNFYWTNMNGLTVDVKVSTDGGTTKTSIEHSLSTATTTKKTAKSIDLSDFEGETVILYFSAQGNSTSLKYLYIDEVSLGYAPVAVPTNLTATPKDGGADVVWATDESGTWNLRYREYNAEPEANWTLVEGLTAKSKELTGLTNGTTYEVQVKTIASANRESDWTASATFTPVACASVTAVTLSQDTYENLNVNWTTTGTGTWELRYQQGDLGWSSPITNINDTYYLLEELVTGVPYSVEVKPSCGDDATWVAAAGTFTLTYTAPVAAEAENITENSATVQWLRPADAIACQYAFVLPGAAANWKENVALIATVDTLQAGTDYLFVVRSKYPTGVSEADTTEFSTITIAPKNLQLNGDPTTTSAAFTWTAQGMATRWQWSLDQTDWTTVPTASATVDELEAGSSYTLYVRSLYDNGAYSAAISLPFQTACGVATLPFEETFGTVSGTKPNCWTIANWSGTAANSWYTYNDFAHSGQALRYNARTLSSADAVSPAIELSKDSELKFYIKNSVGTGSDKVECKVLVNDGTETNELADITTRYTAATQHTFDLSEYTGKTVNLIFRGVGYNTSGSPCLWIDDVTVTEKPETPTAIGNTEAGVQVMKTIENGQLIIIRDGIRYNAQGVLVK